VHLAVRSAKAANLILLLIILPATTHQNEQHNMWWEAVATANRLVIGPSSS
jgi:hypothetical protein